MTDGVPSVATRPTLKPWFSRLAEQDEIVFANGAASVKFEGRAVQALLTDLLPLLDGRHTVDDIVAQFGETAREPIVAALELFERNHLLLEGAVGDGNGRGPLAPGAVDTLSFFAATGLRSGRELPTLVHALEEARFRLVGEGTIVDHIADLLHASGARAIERSHETDVLDPSALTIATPSAADDVDTLDRINKAALDANAPWMMILPFDGSFAAVGPVFLPHQTCCYECFQLRRSANAGVASVYERLRRSRQHWMSPPFLDAMLAGLATRLAVGYALGTEHQVVGRFYSVTLAPDVQLRLNSVYRIPRCPACSGLVNETVAMAWGDT